MKSICYLYLPLLFFGQVHASLIDEAAEKLRAGDAVGTLTLLSGEDSEAGLFWKGRALVELGRMREASACLAKVTESHELFPYAAKALLYCAWQSPDVEFTAILSKLAASRHPEIAGLAAAALAEFWLQQPESQDNTALELLREMADKKPEFIPVLKLLEIENLRQKKQYKEAVQLCRHMEEDRTLSTEMRQRIRLSLAEVYYAQESAEDVEDTEQTNNLLSGITTPGATETDEEPVPLSSEGKGEETLLHFISTNPESPLLTEAFRRLAAHKAFSTGKYARAKLQEWIADTEKPSRAALSLLILQHLTNMDNPDDVVVDNACANTALTLFPGEKSTQLILLEQTRLLIDRGDTEQAAKYLSYVTLESPYKEFYAATILAEKNPAEAAHMFRNCAGAAPEALRPAAFANALLCALRSGNVRLEEEILEYPNFSPEEKAEVYAALFLHNVGKDDTRARQALHILQGIPYNESKFMIDVLLDKAWFNLKDSPLMVEQELGHIKTTNFLPRQLLRYYMIREEAVRNAFPADRKSEIEDRISELLLEAIRSTSNKHLNHKLRFHLAHHLSRRGLHAEAYSLLMGLNSLTSNSNMAAQSLFNAAHEKELIGTAEALNEAISIYAACADKYPELRVRASIQQSSILTRTGRGEEAEAILRPLLHKPELLSPEEKAHILITLSVNYMLEGTAASLQQAYEAGQESIKDFGLPKDWRYTVLLHHASICSKIGNYQAALESYRAVLDMNPAGKDNSTDREWAIFHQAAIGAIASLLELKKFSEAITLAEDIADWKSDSGRTRKLKRYAEWADYIRQTNFLRKEE